MRYSSAGFLWQNRIAWLICLQAVPSIEEEVVSHDVLSINIFIDEPKQNNEATFDMNKKWSVFQDKYYDMTNQIKQYSFL